MKPRQDSARPTWEDREIWLRLGGPGRGWQFLMPAFYLNADRRDADLMLASQQAPYMCVAVVPPIGGERFGAPIDVRGGGDPKWPF